MPLFDTEGEARRKENLRLLEDKRLRFAQEMDARGFRPEKMLFCSTEDGMFVGVARWNDGLAVVVGPRFGSDEDFRIEFADHFDFEQEEIFEKGTGLNGMFGFGRKGANGYVYHITLGDGSDAPLCAVLGRTSWLECDYKHNSLLKTKRRRGDANFIWDFLPFERDHVRKVAERLENLYLTRTERLQ